MQQYQLFATIHVQDCSAFPVAGEIARKQIRISPSAIRREWVDRTIFTRVPPTSMDPKQHRFCSKQHATGRDILFLLKANRVAKKRILQRRKSTKGLTVTEQCLLDGVSQQIWPYGEQRRASQFPGHAWSFQQEARQSLLASIMHAADGAGQTRGVRGARHTKTRGFAKLGRLSKQIEGFERHALQHFCLPRLGEMKASECLQFSSLLLKERFWKSFLSTFIVDLQGEVMKLGVCLH